MARVEASPISLMTASTRETWKPAFTSAVWRTASRSSIIHAVCGKPGPARLQRDRVGWASNTSAGRSSAGPSLVPLDPYPRAAGGAPELEDEPPISMEFEMCVEPAAASAPTAADDVGIASISKA